MANPPYPPSGEGAMVNLAEMCVFGCRRSHDRSLVWIGPLVVPVPLWCFAAPSSMADESKPSFVTAPRPKPFPGPLLRFAFDLFFFFARMRWFLGDVVDLCRNAGMRTTTNAPQTASMLAEVNTQRIIFEGKANISISTIRARGKV